MRKILQLFAKTCIVLLLGFGIFKSYDFYKQNKLERKYNKSKQVSPDDKHFAVVIFAHNNTTHCEKSLLSAVTQNYENFRILYIDDASTDNTFTKVSTMMTQSPLKDKVTFFRNKKSKGSLASLYEIIHTCENHEIVLLVEGSDFLAHENVLSKLNKVYSKPSTWMTYGNFLDYPSYRQIPVKCKQFPKNIVFNNSFRSHELVEVHLKTFYAGLFKQIHKEDLLYKEQFISTDATLAYFLPLLEMAGKHACFINEVLYLHTTKKTPPSLPAECVSHIRKLPQYKRLKALPFEQSS